MKVWRSSGLKDDMSSGAVNWPTTRAKYDCRSHQVVISHTLWDSTSSSRLAGYTTIDQQFRTGGLHYSRPAVSNWWVTRLSTSSLRLAGYTTIDQQFKTGGLHDSRPAVQDWRVTRLSTSSLRLVGYTTLDQQNVTAHYTTIDAAARISPTLWSPTRWPPVNLQEVDTIRPCIKTSEFNEIILYTCIMLKSNINTATQNATQKIEEKSAK